LAVSLLTADRPTQLRFLRTNLRPVFVPLGVVSVFAVAWTIGFRAYLGFAHPATHPITLGEIVRESLGMTGTLLAEIVAYLGQLTVRPPLLSLLAWTGIVGLVALIAAYRATRRSQLALAVGLALVLVIPFVLTATNYPRANVGAYQGRYTLPLSIGVALLAVAAARCRPVHPRRVVAAAWVMLALFAVGQAAAVVGAVRAFAPFTLQPTQASGLVVLGTGLAVLGVRIVAADRARPELSDVD
jgi:hypothetical protein